MSQRINEDPSLPARKISVAHVTTIAVSQRYLLLNQLLSISNAGYEVTAVSSRGEEVAYLEAKGISHRAVPMTRRITPFADILSLWRLFRLFRREKFCIVHTHNPKPGLLGQLAAKLAGVPIVVNTIHGYYFTNRTSPLMRSVFVILERIAASCSDVIWSQNREDISTALEMGICDAEKIKYLGNGIDLEAFDPLRIDQAMLRDKRAELGIPVDMLIVGFVGRLVTEKGVHELIQAAVLVLRQKKNVRFLIIGPTDFDKKDAITPAILDAYGIADACIFTGLRHDMPELYALMNVFVLPSHREGLPRAPMEASAMKVPCVVTDIRGCREVVEHGRNGLLVPLGDVTLLADVIVELLVDEVRAEEMGEVGRQMAIECFDEKLVFAQVKAEYSRLLLQNGLLAPSDVIAGESVEAHLVRSGSG